MSSESRKRYTLKLLLICLEMPLEGFPPFLGNSERGFVGTFVSSKVVPEDLNVKFGSKFNQIREKYHTHIVILLLLLVIVVV